MPVYRLAFYGRKVGALGISSFQVIDIEAPNLEAAKLKVYDAFEHISGGNDGIAEAPNLKPKHD
jgi:hypothetical protein